MSTATSTDNSTDLTIEALVAQLAAANERIEALEARSGIEAAMVKYMCACDVPSGKGEAVAAAFTRNGIWEAADKEGDDHAAWAAQGTEALIKKFDRNHTRLPFSIHYLTNGRIELLGDGRARGKWYYFEPCTFRDEVALWTAGHYVNDFEVEDGVWKLSHLRVRTFFSTRFEDGWLVDPAYDTA
ncbi:MAG: nuclear transport factor 2 family protein [Actinomycetota bacterium]|nr:nuclear transport factor 2 family protein [Actinomycetota bacterium]